MILREVPEAVVTGSVGRRSSFEITLNNKLIFSKLTAGSFPLFKSVVDEVIKAKKGLPIEEVTEKQASSCILS